MRRILFILISLCTLTSITYGQCPTLTVVNPDETRLFLNFPNDADALVYFNAAGGNNVVMTVSPGGTGPLQYSSNNTKLRIMLTTLTAGSYTGTVTSPSGLSCIYVDGLLTSTSLPVSLSSFTAKKMEKSVLLEWKTESETNNDHFIVERSTDGISFKQLNVVRGQGNSSTQVVYNFEDKNPRSTTNYYRLRQFDYDGTESHSSIVSMEFLETQFEDYIELKLYPTIVQNEINFDLINFDDGNLTLEILNATGQIIVSKNIVSNDINTFNVNDLNLSDGVFYARCRSNSQVAVGKFLVVK